MHTSDIRYGVSPDKVTLEVNGRTSTLDWLLANLPAATDVRVYNCAGLTALPDLPAARIVRVDNCAGLTAVYGGEHRGYKAYAVCIRGAWRVVAGCRNLTFAEARKHWQADVGALEIVARLEGMVEQLADCHAPDRECV